MYTVEIQREGSYRGPVTKAMRDHRRAENKAATIAERQPSGTRVYVTTQGVVLTTYTAI